MFWSWSSGRVGSDVVVMFPPTLPDVNTILVWVLGVIPSRDWAWDVTAVCSIVFTPDEMRDCWSTCVLGRLTWVGWSPAFCWLNYWGEKPKTIAIDHFTASLRHLEMEPSLASTRGWSWHCNDRPFWTSLTIIHKSITARSTPPSLWC
jgi:hypothetical protein